MRISTMIRCLALVAFMGSNTARAHALLDRADPKVGSSIKAAPHEVSLSFTQNLEASFSSMEVTDASGRRVDQGKPSINGNVMRVSLQAIQPGTYRVQWHVLSVDTHTTEGSFTFRVGNK